MAIDPHLPSLSHPFLSPEIVREWSSLAIDEANSVNMHSLKGLLAAVLRDNGAQWQPLLQSVSAAARKNTKTVLTSVIMDHCDYMIILMLLFKQKMDDIISH